VSEHRNRLIDPTGETNPNSQGPDHIMDDAQAMGRYLILERKTLGGATKGKIVIPDAVQDVPAWIVVSKGKDVTIPVEEGDRVLFQGGSKVEFDSRTFGFVDQGAIMAVLSKDVSRKYFSENAPHVAVRNLQ
jgi:co-chaperonin GroES (HSP10)